MFSLGDRLREERKRLGYSQVAFAALGGASKGSQLAWEKGAAAPNAEFLHLIARFGVDVLYVITGQRSSNGLSVEEAELLAVYRQLDPQGRAGLLALMKGMERNAGARVKVQGDVAQFVEGDMTVEAPVTINMSKKRKN